MHSAVLCTPENQYENIRRATPDHSWWTDCNFDRDNNLADVFLQKFLLKTAAVPEDDVASKS